MKTYNLAFSNCQANKVYIKTGDDVQGALLIKGEIVEAYRHGKFLGDASNAYLAANLVMNEIE